jgi:hypothetical protein
MAMISRDVDVFPADLAGCFPPSATTPGERPGLVASRVEKGGRALRPIAVLLGVLLLVVAGCSGDDEPAATTTQEAATTQPAAESTTSLSSAVAAVDATVLYEPGKCTYLGPAVVPLGSTVTFEFDDGGHAVWFAVGKLIDGATREEVVEYNETHGGPDTYALGPPDYAVSPEPEYYQVGTGSLQVEFWDDCDWAVLCWTPPDLTNKFYLGGMIQVIEG